MGIGQYRYRITIEHDVSSTRDGAGEQVADWQPFTPSRPADVAYMGGSQMFRGQQLDATVSVVFTTRYVTGVDPAMRVNYAGRIYHIVQTRDAGKGHRRHLEIHCKSSVDNATP